MLNEVDTLADLDEAIEHFRALLNSGIITPDVWAAEAESVVLEVCEWGAAVGHSTELN